MVEKPFIRFKEEESAVSQRRLNRWLLFVPCIVLVASAVWLAGPSVQADVRRTKPRAHFKSGAARQETVLREILAQLKKTDARIAKIESFIDKIDGMTRPAAKGRQRVNGAKQPTGAVRTGRRSNARATNTGYYQPTRR